MRTNTSYAKAFSFILLNTFLWLFTYVNAQESQQGYASFYHDKFNGRKTASGERFSNKAYTCAHRSLPFGTKLEVTNISNGKYVVVTVNDRGPYNYKRIVDVTKQAARELEFIGKGTAKVLIRVLEQPNVITPVLLTDSENNLNLYGVNIGTYDSHTSIPDLSKRMMDDYGLPVYVRKQQMVEGVTYVVYAGSFNNKQQAEAILDSLSTSFPSAKVEAYDSSNVK